MTTFLSSRVIQTPQSGLVIDHRFKIEWVELIGSQQDRVGQVNFVRLGTGRNVLDPHFVLSGHPFLLDGNKNLTMAGRCLLVNHAEPGNTPPDDERGDRHKDQQCSDGESFHEFKPGNRPSAGPWELIIHFKTATFCDLGSPGVQETSFDSTRSCAPPKPKPGNGSKHNRSDSQQDQANRYTVDDGQYRTGFIGKEIPQAHTGYSGHDAEAANHPTPL